MFLFSNLLVFSIYIISAEWDGGEVIGEKVWVRFSEMHATQYIYILLVFWLNGRLHHHGFMWFLGVSEKFSIT